jgi:hypothetical protein
MTGSDDEFEDFLRRRKPVFRSPDDLFEPPADIDRIVLRQAREAIEADRPMRMYSGSRWAAPLALAATLVLAVAVVFQVGMPHKLQAPAEVTVQNAAQRIDYPAVVETAERADAATASSEAVVQLSKSAVTRGEVAPSSPPVADRYAAPPPPAAPVLARDAREATPRERAIDVGRNATPGMIPDWRRNSQTWLAEIDRLRNAGDTARANAELEEYKRQHRALAVAPSR